MASFVEGFSIFSDQIHALLWGYSTIAGFFVMDLVEDITKMWKYQHDQIIS